jgi:hypothetical protein
LTSEAKGSRCKEIQGDEEKVEDVDLTMSREAQGAQRVRGRRHDGCHDMLVVLIARAKEDGQVGGYTTACRRWGINSTIC